MANVAGEEIFDECPDNAAPVKADMRVEIHVLGGDRRILHILRDFGKADNGPSFVSVYFIQNNFPSSVVYFR